MADPVHDTADIPRRTILPLTVFDNFNEHSCITTGWLVQGILDAQKIDEALSRVVAKWPLLSGRIVKGSKPKQYCIEVPANFASKDYRRFGLTWTDSALPLSHYVKLPLDTVTKALPAKLFTHPARLDVGSFDDFIKKDQPLMHWHITYFKQAGHEYSCIGFHRNHGVFDGMGASFISHALEAELSHTEWVVPTPLSPGLNENQFESLLHKASEDRNQEDTLMEDYHVFSIVHLWGAVTMVLWYLWEWHWNKVETAIIIIPLKAHAKLVDDARKALVAEGIGGDVRLSTGDVIAAWLLKVAYHGHSKPNTVINLMNMASLRSSFGDQLAKYPHNCFVPLEYPLLSVSEINTLSLQALAYKFATVRSSGGIKDGVKAYRRLKEAEESKKFAVAMPFDMRADGHLILTNESVARVVDIDWSGAGGGRVACRYKYVLKAGLKTSNLVSIAGRLDDGGLILDCVFAKKRLDTIKLELRRMIRNADVSES